MLVKLNRGEYIKRRWLAILISPIFLGKRVVSLPKFCLGKYNFDKNDCLCERCNTAFKGHYGVGYYSCKNKPKFKVL